MSRLKTVCKN
uniref:Uncharacterized protein n=1 Tax=Anguilla anguilla TaxID=7936 RepID=A0A0E9UWK3_ANGAN